MLQVPCWNRDVMPEAELLLMGDDNAVCEEVQHCFHSSYVGGFAGAAGKT